MRSAEKHNGGDDIQGYDLRSVWSSEKPGYLPKIVRIAGL
jgi:hypothetical protein